MLKFKNQLIRNIKKEYGLGMQLGAYFIIIIIFKNIIFLLENFDIGEHVCLGPIPLAQTLYDIKNIIFVSIVMIYPVMISKSTHVPLTSSMEMTHCKFFLKDNYLYGVFDKFLQSLKSNPKKDIKDGEICK